MIQGTMSGAGKSTVTAALCRILSDDGYRVAPFKSQNMSRNTHKMVSCAQALQARAARCPITPDINPIVLVPNSDTTSMVYVRGTTQGIMNATQYYDFAAKTGMDIAITSLQTLQDKYDIIVLEGAGSPAEINIPCDIANMRMAEAAAARVIIVSDIERGGCFAQMVGTMTLLEKQYQDIVGGFLINKFRGDYIVLEPGIRTIQDMTGVPVMGVMPYMETQLPAEDSMDTHSYMNMDSPNLDTAINGVAKILQDNIDLQQLKSMAGLC